MAAIGCIPQHHIEAAAAAIYRDGTYLDDFGLRIRLIAVGREQNGDLAARFPQVTQLIWSNMLEFIWDRFHTYRNQKTQVAKWDDQGLKIKELADSCDDPESFVEMVLPRIW
ncbi:MAG: hypothetical protein WBN88_05255 [Anderseniella sp.]